MINRLSYLLLLLPVSMYTMEVRYIETADEKIIGLSYDAIKDCALFEDILKDLPTSGSTQDLAIPLACSSKDLVRFKPNLENPELPIDFKLSGIVDLVHFSET